MRRQSKPSLFWQFVRVGIGLNVLCVVMFGLDVLRDKSWSDWYLLWNLFLAWLPLVFAGLLAKRLKKVEWSSWSVIGLALAWALFLPNSFYIVSDLIHLQEASRQDVLFDSLTFTLFVLSGLFLGFVSLYIVQRAMRLRGVVQKWLDGFAAVVLLSCSFAIYLGRDLRWNSWDVLVNPAGIIFDISERIIDPLDHPATFTTTATFFIFLMGLYLVATRLAVIAAKYRD